MKRKSRRIFGLTLALSLFVFLTVAGCVAVDAEGRRLSFGDDQPPFQVERSPEGEARLEVKLFGVEETFPFTMGDKILTTVREFFCLPSL